MGFIPALFTVSLEVRDSSGTDPLGVPVVVWGAPVAHSVCGWATPTSTEPKLAGHDRVIVDVELYAPTAFPANPHDRVLIEGKRYEVVGEAEDFTHGPFWDPGVKVWNLRRVDG